MQKISVSQSYVLYKVNVALQNAFFAQMNSIFKLKSQVEAHKKLHGWLIRVALSKPREKFTVPFSARQR